MEKRKGKVPYRCRFPTREKGGKKRRRGLSRVAPDSTLSSFSFSSPLGGRRDTAARKGKKKKVGT